jgi:effector-binding domain-containing protein
MTPEIRDCPERLTAMHRQVIHPHDIGMTIGLGAQQLRERLIAAGAEVRGAPYARYHSFTKDETDIEVGFEVAAPVDLPDVQMSTLSAGREAVLAHHGAYMGIPKTFALLEAWVGDNAGSRGVAREVYLSDPNEIPMAQRRTEIVWPVD